MLEHLFLWHIQDVPVRETLIGDLISSSTMQPETCGEIIYLWKRNKVTDSWCTQGRRPAKNMLTALKLFPN